MPRVTPDDEPPNMLTGGGTVAARWPDGTLRDGAGNAFLTGHNVSELTNDAGYITGAFSPANPGHWVGSPPATIAEAINRLAAAMSNGGANLIP